MATGSELLCVVGSTGCAKVQLVGGLVVRDVYRVSVATIFTI
jgi:hypothetical protein